MLIAVIFDESGYPLIKLFGHLGIQFDKRLGGIVNQHPVESQGGYGFDEIIKFYRFTNVAIYS
jgi:hypothetical protein